MRVQLSGKRIKANGRIVAAASDANPAFAAYYDLYTDETGATKRLGMTVTVAERESPRWSVTSHMFWLSRATRSWRSRSACVTVIPSRLVAPVSSVSRS